MYTHSHLLLLHNPRHQIIFYIIYDIICDIIKFIYLLVPQVNTLKSVKYKKIIMSGWKAA